MAAITRIFHVAQPEPEPEPESPCMMHVCVGVGPCVWVCVCVCVCALRNMKIRNAGGLTLHSGTWSAVPFECQRQLPRILDASSSVLNAPAWVSWGEGEGGQAMRMEVGFVWGTSDKMSGHYA